MMEHDQLEEKLREQKHAYDDMPKISTPDNIIRYIEETPKSPLQQRRWVQKLLPFAAGIVALFVISALVYSQFQSERQSASQNEPTEQFDSGEMEIAVEDTPNLPDDMPNSIDKVREMFAEMKQADIPPAQIDEVFMVFLQSRNRLLKKEQSELNQIRYDADDIVAVLDKPDRLENKELEKFVKKAVEHGFSFDNREATLKLVIPYDKYLEWFRSYVSDKMGSYLQLESDRIVLKEGSLAATWNDVGDELVRLEQFLKKWPDFTFHLKLKERYIRNLRLYFHGSINTFPFQHGTDVLKDEVKASYQYVMETYPDTTTASIVREYYEKLEDNHFRELQSEYTPKPLPKFLKGVEKSAQ